MSKQAPGLVLSPPGVAAGPGCCDPLAVRALTAEQAGLVAPMFKALGDPVRLRLMSMIASRPEACVCDLTGAFDVSGPTISHHLRVLREAGLVDAERRGTWVYYRVRPEAVAQLGALLDLSGRSGT
jgi:ArsR family transcriptional regulator, arsenate/arsenite/antimonite-responsive transcriptional repressor